MQNILQSQNIFILGLGKSGIATYNFLKEQGINVSIWDDNLSVREKYSNLNLQNYKDLDFAKISLVVCSPGIALKYPMKHYIYKKSQEFNFEIIADIELFIRLFPHKKYIGVTGTNGKSTTASLIYHIFKSVNKNVALGGNIGIPVFDASLQNKDIIILELSSYQLELMFQHKLHCAMLLNLEPDHLEHHGSYDNYKAMKHKIFNNQGKADLAIVFAGYNQHPQNSLIISNKSLPQDKIISYENGDLVDYYFENGFICNLRQLSYLKGEHNYQNIAFSYACAKFFKIATGDIISAIASFKGLEHRQQVVTKFNNIVFVNDSKSTNQASTKPALLAFDNIYLILGGVIKEINLDDILSLLKNVKMIYLIGSSVELFKNILLEHNINFTIANTLENAVNLAYELALLETKDEESTILLSPACASFDQFLNFEDRGQQFINIVNTIKNIKIK